MRSAGVKKNKLSADLDAKANEAGASPGPKRHREFTSTVGRGKAIVRETAPDVNFFKTDLVQVQFGNSLKFYDAWSRPTCIVSDGAYGVLGFEGDTSDHLGMPEWYEPHVEAWSKAAT